MSFDVQPLVDFANSLMNATCTIVDEPGGSEDDALDQASGLLTADAETVIYTGMCGVKWLGEPTVEKPATWEVHIPVTAMPVPKPQQKITIVTSDADPALVGRVLRIRAVSAATLAVQRKCECTGW